MAIQQRLMTIEDYESFLESHEGVFELIKGEVVEKVLTEEHGIIVVNIATEIRIYLKQNPIGRVAVEARYRPKDEKYNDRLPDISVRITDEPVVKKGVVEGMPDLAVEVKSPTDSNKLMREKANYYLENGCRMVWLVYPDKAMVEIYHKDADIEILFAEDVIRGGDVLPEFELKVGTILV